jgi:hypothetical protein
MSTMIRTFIDLAELTPETLAALDEREFRFVVDADLRRNATSRNIRRQDVPAWVSQALRTSHVERWVAALRSMLVSVDGQLAQRRLAGEDRQALAKISRFRSAVLEALPEAEALLGGRVQELEAAIATHRRAVEADDTMDPSTADTTLWESLNTERRTNTNHETDACSIARTTVCQ